MAALGIKRVDHISWAVWSIGETLPMLKDLFGMTEVERFRNEERGYVGIILSIPGGNLQLELLEPTSDESYIARFLRERGPALHHVTFEVNDIFRAGEAIRRFGIEPWGGVVTHGGWGETYIHPRDSGGVLFQFFQELEPHEHHSGA